MKIFQTALRIFTSMKRDYYIIGAMSGTSLDGIDLAYVHFELTQNWNFRFLAAETVPYTLFWKKRLKKSLSLSENDLENLNQDYTCFLANCMQAFIQKNHISKLDAVCSHGHTVFHQPKNGISLQIGNLPILSKMLKQTIVCDFRKQDVLLGGQGAPLVPVGDRLLFANYTFCLNLGGFANISTEKNGIRIAFDICAVNTVMNFYAEKLGVAYDDGGKLAALGKIDQKLLKILDSLAFYQKSAPKSLGMEWVNEKVFPLIEKAQLSPINILTTYVEHVASQIVKTIGSNENQQVLVTGGGAYNDFLLKKIQEKTNTRLFIPEKKLVEFKEALIFGVLGVLKLRHEINVLSSVTGASHDHSAGVIYKY